MINNLKRLAAAACAVFVTASALPVSAAFADNLEGPDEALTDGTFTYELAGGGYTVVSCDPTAIVLEFPEMRNGYPITAISDYAFEGCTSITELDIPNTVRYIGASAFSGCTSLERVSIPENVTSISEGMFLGCSSLSRVELPDTLTTIGSYAFAYCSALSEIDLPESLSYIGGSAFIECSSLADIKAENNTSFTVENGLLLNSSKDMLYRASTSLSGTVYLQEGISEIGSGAFSGCMGIEKMYIQQGVSKIGDYAFRDCLAMSSVDIPNGVTEIGTGAFMYCDALETVELPVSLEKLGSSAFMGCVSLRRAIMQEGLTSLGEQAFLGCSQLKTLAVPKTITAVGDHAYGYTIGSDGEKVKLSDVSMSVYSGSAGEKYAKSNGITYTTIDRSLKRTAFIIIAVGLLLAAAVFAAVLMARSRKGAPAGAKKAKKLEKERAEEESYEKIVDDK